MRCWFSRINNKNSSRLQVLVYTCARKKLAPGFRCWFYAHARKKTAPGFSLVCINDSRMINQPASSRLLMHQNMLHSFVRNYLHITWSTKNRDRVFTGSSKIELKDFILEKSKEIQCPVLAINVQPEHIHFLIDLPADLCLSDLTRKIKGSSSHWLNEQNLIQEEYIEWKKNYGFFDD